MRTIGEEPGVNLAGYLRTESGVGAAARGYVRALQRIGLPVALHDLSDLTGNRSQDGALSGFVDDHPYEVSLVCADVEPHYAIVARLGREFFQGHYSIGVWAWELPRFPEKWLDRFAYYDEIWVGSSFIANALAPISPIPVIRIPPVLTLPEHGLRARGRERLGAGDDEFVFLFIFDFHSHMERKNPLAAVDAFRMAFEPDERARLVIKCVNANSSPDGFAALQERSSGHRISIVEGYWPSPAIRDLTAACDTYVSLHRSEGTGLTITDAMAAGKPVIATAWSGNMDFMSPSNSYPVAYELQPIEASIGPYRSGEVWADPSTSHAASLMRHVFEQREQARRRGERAQADIEVGFGEGAIGMALARRFEGIRRARRLPELRQEAWQDFAAYQDLGQRIRELVQDRVPPDATVLVVSKGDEALLPHGERRSWHFPRTDEGTYAGSYPADSQEAIRHLESLRMQGGDYLVVPQPSLWWLDHYAGFRRHLDGHYRRIVQDSDTCLIYALQEAG